MIGHGITSFKRFKYLFLLLFFIQNIYTHIIIIKKQREIFRLFFNLFDFEFQLFKLQKKILPTKIFKIGKKF